MRQKNREEKSIQQICFQKLRGGQKHDVHVALFLKTVAFVLGHQKPHLAPVVADGPDHLL
jgi:hypothetical protein